MKTTPDDLWRRGAIKLVAMFVTVSVVGMYFVAPMGPGSYWPCDAVLLIFALGFLFEGPRLLRWFGLLVLLLALSDLVSGLRLRKALHDAHVNVLIGGEAELTRLSTNRIAVPNK